MNNQLILLDKAESGLRLEKIQRQMTQRAIDAMLVADNATVYYLTGRVFDGYIYLTATDDPLYFVRRPIGLKDSRLHYLRKPEEIPSLIGEKPAKLALELDVQSYSVIERLKKLFPEAKIENASPVIRQARACKTEVEIERIRLSGFRQDRVYRHIPKLFRDGMTDLELQIEIERFSRLEGCLGQFRISGQSMELYMGNVLAGENADTPTPYDFAMGGEGADPSLPVGANGTIIERGMSIMVDVNGNYTGYMTDMTRTFAPEQLPSLAVKAHQTSIDICHALADMAVPGIEAAEMYRRAEQMAAEAGLSEYFMGHRQKAGFVGHGVGIEINELPVIAPRSRDIIAVGNVFALEPKFVIPKVGAVGIENTYVVNQDSTECLTTTPEEIIYLL